MKQVWMHVEIFRAIDQLVERLLKGMALAGLSLICAKMLVNLKSSDTVVPLWSVWAVQAAMILSLVMGIIYMVSGIPALIEEIQGASVKRHVRLLRLMIAIIALVLASCVFIAALAGTILSGAGALEFT